MGTIANSSPVASTRKIASSLAMITAVMLVMAVFGVAIEYDMWHETNTAYTMAFVGVWVFTIVGFSLATWLCRRQPSLKPHTPYLLLLFAFSVTSLSFGTYIQLKYQLNHLAPFIAISTVIMTCTLTIILVGQYETSPSGKSRAAAPPQQTRSSESHM